MNLPSYDFSRLATWDPALRAGFSMEDAAAAAVLRDPVVEHFRADGKDVASFPALAMQLFGSAERRDWDPTELVQVIGRDPVIAAHVIKASNSAYFVGVREIETLHDAVMRMGTREAANMAVTAAMRALFDPESRAIQRTFVPLWSRLWEHSLRSAAGARWLAQRLRVGDPERAFLGGLLHDIGKTFALRSFAAMIVAGQIRGPVQDRLAAELLEGAHGEIGVEVAVFWSFPEFLTAVCMRHHESDLPADAVEIHLVRVASAVEEMVFNPWYRDGLEAELEASCRALGIEPPVIEELAAAIGGLAARAAAGL